MFGIKGIEAVQFGSGVMGIEAPVDGSLGGVALSNQGLDLPPESFFVGETLSEAGAGQYAELKDVQLLAPKDNRSQVLPAPRNIPPKYRTAALSSTTATVRSFNQPIGQQALPLPQSRQAQYRENRRMRF